MKIRYSILFSLDAKVVYIFILITLYMIVYIVALKDT